ncbi:hypothetical protein AB4Y45_33620 [Paraburkholderia sp. EG287A]|uniref:hypothetical protein n=1 Tax=Paraburkholderia sp. EG287A TaxID=3237012 RepID=UPI0034D1FAF0
MSMTDKQVVEGAERMARELLSIEGFKTLEPSIRASTNPRAVKAWKTVEMLLEAYNGTDLQSAVANVADDDIAPTLNPALFKPKLRDFFYRIEGFNLFPGSKTAGFVLFVATEALARLRDVKVSVEEYQALQMRALERISRIDKLPKKLASRARIGLYPGTAIPARFVTDEMFGGSIGADPEDIGRLAEQGAEAIERIGSMVEYTPHNCDAPVQALMLHILVQTWGEWASAELLAQDLAAERRG